MKDRKSDRHSEAKTNVMFWTETRRKKRYERACQRRGLSMTAAFERLLDAMITDKGSTRARLVVDLSR